MSPDRRRVTYAKTRLPPSIKYSLAPRLADGSAQSRNMVALEQDHCLQSVACICSYLLYFGQINRRYLTAWPSKLPYYTSEYLYI